MLEMYTVCAFITMIHMYEFIYFRIYVNRSVFCYSMYCTMKQCKTSAHLEREIIRTVARHN